MGDIERLVAEADDGTVDEAFLQHLSRGGELLAANRIAEARDVLEQAWQLHPRNQKAQNLLGLTYFKLGTFDRAAEIYELLVRDNPVDPTLRVNLGLVYLKQSALQRAIREFETAVDLAPDHKKAQNYLGLAYAQTGEFSRAKDCFVAAGSLTMAEKMERALKDEASRSPPKVAAVQAPPVAKPAQAESSDERDRDGGEVDVEIDLDSSEDLPAVDPGRAEARPSLADASAWSVGEEPAGGAARPVAVQAAPATGEAEVEVWPQAYGAVPSLAELTRALVVAAPEGQGPFSVGADAVLMRVEGELLTRLDGLLAVSGTVRCAAEMKRFRGRATDKPFGELERRMVRASGSGMLMFAPRERVFVPVELGEESAYFKEDGVFAFEETVVFENGRVPSKIAPDLHLVHLRGKGKVLLGVEAALWSVGVVAGSPCVIPLKVLVGWHGPLTPRIVSLAEEREGEAIVPAVELTGDGYAILTGMKPEPR